VTSKLDNTSDQLSGCSGYNSVSLEARVSLHSQDTV